MGGASKDDGSTLRLLSRSSQSQGPWRGVVLEVLSHPAYQRVSLGGGGVPPTNRLFRWAGFITSGLVRPRASTPLLVRNPLGERSGPVQAGTMGATHSLQELEETSSGSNAPATCIQPVQFHAFGDH